MSDIRASEQLKDDKEHAEAERERTERERQEAEARFHAVFDVNPAPAIIVRLMDERV